MTADPRAGPAADRRHRDLKGFYAGTSSTNAPDPVLYGLVAELLPDA